MPIDVSDDVSLQNVLLNAEVVFRCISLPPNVSTIYDILYEVFGRLGISQAGLD